MIWKDQKKKLEMNEGFIFYKRSTRVFGAKANNTYV